MMAHAVTTYPVGIRKFPLRRIAEGEGKKIPERLLAIFWKERAARLTALRTEAGRRVRVVYPGRSGVTAGPDFRDALLEVEGVAFVRGDVELHIKQKDWDSHGHGGDPNYNGVVFHGALEVHSNTTRLQSGVMAPVVDLSALLADSQTQSDGDDSEAAPLIDLWQVLAKKGFPRPKSLAEIENILDRAGDLRFKWKSNWLYQCIQAEGPDQALYQGLMEGLGYRVNQRPFIELASVAPYEAVSWAARELKSDGRYEAICRWLLRCSGLGFPERSFSENGMVEPRSKQKTPRGLGRSMNQKEWRLFRVRPTNHPRRRIMGAAAFLDRFLEAGLASGLEAVVHGGRPARLTTALCVDGGSGPAYVGRGRAKDLAVNVVLPFVHGWDKWRARETGAEKGLHGSEGGEPSMPEALYRRYSLLA